MYANILIDRSHSNIDRTFTYKVPDTLLDKVQIGKRVSVPFGARNNFINGYIIELTNETKISDKIKEIIEIIDDFPLFDLETLKIVNFIKEKYMCNFIDAVNIVIPTGVRNISYDNTQEKYVMLMAGREKIDEITLKYEGKPKYKGQLDIIYYLEEYNEVKLSELKDRLKISDSPINSLIKMGIIKLNMQDKKLKIYNTELKTVRDFDLNNDQLNCIDKISKSMANNVFHEFLLHGVTGSGKTEVYIETVKEAIKQGKQAIVLVPEIGLTPQIVRRFKEHFDDKVVVMHSQLSDTEKFSEWNRVRKGEVSVMIGPRSAVFAPFTNLGIIIIDEEHEMTYKSETTPKYEAKEVAKFRCKNNNAVLIYGSATPSIETYYKAKKDEIELISLKNRINNFELPEIKIIDMREELKAGNMRVISGEVGVKIQETIKRGEQVLVFLNRRGYSTFVSCRKCGYVMKCDNCSVPYTYHSCSDTLECHHCGKIIHNVNLCPECNSKYIKFFGAGTEKVENELANIFKNAKILRMDADTTRKKNSHDNILTAFNEGDADILIGTQMIAKGHDFRNVTLVVILAADSSLNMQDYRAYEKSFQLFTQVGGRAGRNGKQAEVYIQTYECENYVLDCVKNYDYDRFYNIEINVREQLENPPFSKIFSIMFTGKDEKNIIIYINRLKKYLEYYNIKGKYKILGPSSDIINKINGNYRWRMIVKSDDEEKLKNFVLYSLDKFNNREKMKDIKIHLDLE